MRNFFIGTTFIILLLTACGPAIKSATAATPASTQMVLDSPLLSEEVSSLPMAEPSLEDTGKEQTAIGDAVIIYQRSGGFAGIHEQWTIYPDGRIMAGDGREWRVTPEQVERLLTEIEALGFFEMEGRYMPLNTCCDRFTYEITVRHGDTVNTVTTIDAALDAPPELWCVINVINDLVAAL